LTPLDTHTEEMLPEITAFCRGFLLTKDENVERACVFCKAFLVTVYSMQN